ncbi:MAG: avidin/streptavidin family protein [Saprospiraceae bacterium]|nr:avidin/streptavidin family protein [Saprospiraceae bacterium]
MLRILACCLLIWSICAWPTHAQSCSDLQGIWENELGSRLVIAQVTTDHQLQGEYRSSSGVDGQTFPLIGWVNNRGPDAKGPVTISFSVRWEGYGSLTSWTGTCETDEDGASIKTLWHLVRPGPEFAWERIIANSSTFRPVQE